MSSRVRGRYRPARSPMPRCGSTRTSPPGSPAWASLSTPATCCSPGSTMRRSPDCPTLEGPVPVRRTGSSGSACPDRWGIPGRGERFGGAATRYPRGDLDPRVVPPLVPDVLDVCLGGSLRDDQPFRDRTVALALGLLVGVLLFVSCLLRLCLGVGGLGPGCLLVGRFLGRQPESRRDRRRKGQSRNIRQKLV